MICTEPAITVNSWVRPFAEEDPPPLSDRLDSRRVLAQRSGDPVPEIMVRMIVDYEKRHADMLMRSMIHPLQDGSDRFLVQRVAPAGVEMLVGVATTRSVHRQPPSQPAVAAPPRPVGTRC